MKQSCLNKILWPIIIVIALMPALSTCAREDAAASSARPSKTLAKTAIVPEECPPFVIKRPELSPEISYEIFDSWFPEYPDPYPSLPPLFEGDEPLASVAKGQALSDIDTYFTLLRHAYSGYGYFGGDNAFYAAKERVLTALKTLGSDIPTEKLAQIIHDSLSFIEDVHLSIGGFNFNKTRIPCLDETHEIRKASQDGTTAFFLDGTRFSLEIESIDNGPPERFIKQSITEDGRIVYRIAGLFPYEKATTSEAGIYTRLSVKVKGPRGIRRMFFVNAHAVWAQNPKKDTAFQIIKSTGIPHLRIKQMYPLADSDSSLDEFMSAGSSLAGSPAIIADIRKNSGGSDIYGDTFIKNLTGVVPQAYRFERDRHHPYTGFFIRNDLASDWEYYLERFSLKKTDKKTWSGVTLGEPRMMMDDIILFAIIDRGVASAGESFTQNIRLMKYGIIIGAPTAGCVNFGNVNFGYLPCSGIRVSIPQSRFILAFPVRETYGFEPDFWVPPDRGVFRIRSFIERYGFDSIKRALVTDKEMES